MTTVKQGPATLHSASLIHSTTDGDDLIAYMARVSNPANQNTKDSARLISYLIKHNHWSPFEMVNMCVSIETTRSIAAQILRHRSFSFQEFSQRYAAVTEPAIVPELRRQDTKNRQNSIDDLSGEEVGCLQMQIEDHFQYSMDLYERMLEAGVAKECAREVLPLATPTHLYMNGTLRSWIHYCNLRCGNGTQLEHKRIADACKALIQQSFPGTYSAVFAVSE
jgi:thymidylate synthase (FAD)